MAFDARREDYQRLSLQFARTLQGGQADNVRAFAEFAQRYATERDTLPQTDHDRAFHLVAEATNLIDYELPFASDEAAETIVTHARHMLDEALSLDGHCFDAWRMRQAADMRGFDDFYDSLKEREGEVLALCRERRASALRDPIPERARLGSDIAMLPYLRWISAMAGMALVSGRNREVLRCVRTVRELDPNDIADMRLVAAFAYAKLEDEHGLSQLARRVREHRPADDAWFRLARMSLAHKRRDFAAARDELGSLVASYPRAALTLARQQEFPDGIFARILVPPYSEDELLLAVSEGTVLLQEGRDDSGYGVLGSWVMQEALSMLPPDQADAPSGARAPGAGGAR